MKEKSQKNNRPEILSKMLNVPKNLYNDFFFDSTTKMSPKLLYPSKFTGHTRRIVNISKLVIEKAFQFVCILDTALVMDYG